jgi:hypothetical protein
MNLVGDHVTSLFSLTANSSLAFPSIMNVGNKPQSYQYRDFVTNGNPDVFVSLYRHLK